MLKKEPEARISPPEAYDIAMYWRKQGRFVDNIFEPRCFACQWFPYNRHRPRCPRKAWRRKLQRAHIIARSAGGTFAPSNFLMLCEGCHIEAPMVNNSRIMLQWTEDHESHLSIWYREFTDAFGPVIEKFAHLCTADDVEKVIAFFNESNVDFHRRASHAQRMKAMAVVFQAYFENHLLEQLPLFPSLQ